uniref:Uncharacterized protein n=1 Tax=Onchocerca volvulus TaxID=6282 RepID=A0A8R1XTU9_ONCVO
MAKLSICDRLLHNVYDSIVRLRIDPLLLVLRTLGRSIQHVPWNPMLQISLGEGLCLIGTVFTGILGLIGCCRGFGRMFYAQEKMMLDYQNAFIGAYNNARQLNSVIDVSV